MGYSLSTTSPFLKGLNTELNKLVDSTEYTNDELNCMVRANNTRSRRPGLDYEELYKFSNEYLDLSKPDLAFQCIEWTDINSPDESETYTGYPYLVCQVGGKVIFFRNEGAPYSGHQEEYVLDLASYALDSSDAYTRERCKFTAAYGCIFITSKAIRPIYLRSAQNSEDPSLPDPTTPTGSCSVAVQSSKKGRWAGYGWVYFYVNGQYIGGASIQDFNGNRNGNCSSGPWMLCSTQIANAWNNTPIEHTLGITATPKYPDGVATRWGIYSPTMGRNESTNGGWPADYVVFTAPEESGTTLKGTEIKIRIRGLAQSRKKSWDGEVTYTCKLVGGSNYVYKDNISLAIRDTNIGANDYLAVDDTPTKMSYAHLYNLLNQGWNTKLIAEFYAKAGVFPGNNLAQQMLKDEKTEAFKPDNYINMTLGNTPASRGHMVLDFFDQQRVIKSNLVNVFTQLITALNTATGTTKTFADYVDTSWDLEDATQSNLVDAMSQVPDVKPRKPYCADICNYAGRIFYLSGDVLLYSQVIAEDITKADKCYTEADPTSEDMSDVIETDGGMISLPDIGEGIRLQPCGSSLLVFGTRGNMIISGTVNNIFTATAYGAGAINAVPTQAPDSFVSTEYGIFYWGTTGITFVTYGENGVETKDISTERILTFYGKLTNDQHKYCKGIYSSSKKKIYWFYPSNSEMPRRLDLCLVYDIQRDAYAPQKIVSQDDFDGESNTQTPEVVSGVQLKVPFKSVKEYPLYTDVIAPDDTKEFLYMKAVSNAEQPSKDPNYVVTFPAGVSEEGHLTMGNTENFLNVMVSNQQYDGTTDYDFVAKFHVEEDIDIPDLRYGCIQANSSYLPGSTSLPILHLERHNDNDSYLLAARPVSSPYMQYSSKIYVGDYVWTRVTYNAATNTTTIKYIISDTDDYTFNTIGSATEWVTMMSFEGSWMGLSDCTYMAITSISRFQDIGYVDAYNSGDLVRGWKFTSGYGVNLTYTGGDFTADGKINIPGMRVTGKQDFSTTMPYDFVMRVYIANEPVSSADTALNTYAVDPADGTSRHFITIDSGYDHGNLIWYAKIHGSIGFGIPLTAGNVYWLRAYSDEGVMHYFKVLEEGDTPYTFSNIASHPGWATAEEEMYDRSHAFSNHPLWSIHAPDESAGRGSFVDIINSGELTLGWHFIPPQKTILYYDSAAPDAHAYYDSDMTDDAGLLSNFFNDGNRYTKTAYYNWTREAKGTDKVMVQKPWQGVDGLKEDAFFAAGDADSFVNGTKTTAEDDRVFSTVDANEYFYENGRIYYDSVPLTQETALESQLYNWNVTYTGAETGNVEIVDDDGYKVLADEPLDTEEFTYESSILLCLDPSSCKVTFGDFRNNYMRDWAEADQQGDGYLFDSYMISHPVNVGDFVRQKSMPYLISYFKRSETGKTTTGEYLYGSKCQGSVRWDWRTDGLNSKWDRPNELYRPDKRTLLSQGYIITRTNIRGLGRSFQVKVQGVEDNNFIVEAFAFDLQHDERV